MYNDMSHTEVSLWGDHGNKSCMFLAIALIRHANNREPHRLGIKIGETNEEMDNIDFLK